MNWKYYNPKFEYEEKFQDLAWPWAGHKYFAYDLICNLKPKVIVELGTHYGTSLWAFSQVVKDQNIDTELNAVDTWEGDKHAGFYGEEVFETVNKIKDTYYSNLKINLIRKTFDEAVKDFEDNSVDILHIDGLHTYEAVKHDFENWLPKVKENGIVLFHDIVVNRDDFGIYKLWKEIKDKYKTMEFRHSYGLGILFKGNDNLLLESKEELELHYSYLLEDIENSKITHILDESNKKNQDLFLKNQEIKQKDQEIGNKDDIIYSKEQIIEQKVQEIQVKSQEIQLKVQDIQLKDQEINALRNSTSWKITKPIRFIKDKTLRIKNLILSFLRLGKKGLIILKRDGLRIFLQKGFNYFKYKKEYFNDYNLWIKQNENFDISAIKKEINNFNYKPKISIITPVYNVDQKWLDKCIQSVINQFYENWELCLHDDASTKKETIECLKKWEKLDSRIKISYGKVNQHISGASNEAIKLATGEFIALLDNDDELAPHALFENVKLLNENPNADFIYSDEDKIEIDGTRLDPFFKPDWSPDLFYSINYICHLSLMRKEIGDSIGWFRKGVEGAQDFDLFLRFFSKTKEIKHISKILYHWRMLETSTAKSIDSKKYTNNAGKNALTNFLKENNIDAIVENGYGKTNYRLKYIIPKDKLVSIIIPFKDKADILMTCVESIIKKTTYKNYEIILVSNNSAEKETFKYLKTLKINKKIIILERNIPFNFSAINNWAVSQSSGDFIIFLNNDTEVISPEWIDELLMHANKNNIGAVGGMLFYPNNTIQHVGVILGMAGMAGHIFSKQKKEVTYFNLANYVRNYLAVTAACLMISREKFLEVGGFNELFTICGNDVDLCLKLYEKGYLNIYTPYAKLYHHESLSRDKIPPQCDYDISVKRYAPYMGNDPYFNINLSLENEVVIINTKIK